jgi:hypothetical protein
MVKQQRTLVKLIIMTETGQIENRRAEPWLASDSALEYGQIILDEQTAETRNSPCDLRRIYHEHAD